MGTHRMEGNVFAGYRDFSAGVASATAAGKGADRPTMRRFLFASAPAGAPGGALVDRRSAIPYGGAAAAGVLTRGADNAFLVRQHADVAVYVWGGGRVIGNRCTKPTPAFWCRVSGGHRGAFNGRTYLPGTTAWRGAAGAAGNGHHRRILHRRRHR